MRHTITWSVAAAIALLGCGDDADHVDAGPGSGSGSDVDAGPDHRMATGTQIVAHPAQIIAITSDDYIVFSDTNADGHSVAKVVPLAGGPETTIATSTGTGKSDVRVAIDGKVVFVFTDRGNRISTLAIWSAATGVIVKGPGIRPGRAAASADGAFVVYEQDITPTTANLVAGPIAGAATVVASANTADNDCWQDTDIQSTGDVATQRLVIRYCPAGQTAWSLRSLKPDLSSSTELSATADAASYRNGHVVWRESSGNLVAAASGEGSGHTLGSGAVDFLTSDDESTVAWLTSDGAIHARPIDASAAERVLVTDTAKALGALSPDNQTILFASQVEDRGSGFVLPYTDVLAGREGQAPIPLVTGVTSCPSCLHSSFTPDSQDALVLDPIDNSTVADSAGPIHTFSLADGASVSSFGVTTYGTVALPGAGRGAASRFLILDAVRDTTLDTGFAYTLTTQSLEAGATATTVAGYAENFVVDASHTHLAVSFDGSDATAGIWVAPIQ